MSTKRPSDSTKQLRQIRKIIGRNIYYCRTDKEISLRKLGNISQISISDLDMYESGRGKLGIETLARIAAALDIEMIKLLRN